MSSRLTAALFEHGFDADAREIARLALNRTIQEQATWMEIIETEKTARLLLKHSPAGSFDHALSEHFYAFLKAHKATRLLGPLVEYDGAPDTDVAALASAWTQLRGAGPALAWIAKVKGVNQRACALTWSLP